MYLRRPLLLSIRTTSAPARDLGYLLAKHPDRAQAFTLPFGTAHVVYPEATDDGCTCSLLIDVDSVGLVRRDHASSRSIFQYVNDRPYAATSFLCVAISKVFGSAMNGTCTTRPELVDVERDLEAHLPTLPCRGGLELLERLFAPLGYTIDAEERVLDDAFPEWGLSRYVNVRLRGRTTLQRLLQHLYVLIPVLDGDKHYWVGESEVEKLLAKGATWLGDHPDRELIAQRYLKNDRALTRSALEQLTENDPEVEASDDDTPEVELEKPISLQRQRMDTVTAALVNSGATSVIDLGCGEGQLLRELIKAKRGTRSAFDRILGVDVSNRALERAAGKLRLERMAPKKRERIALTQGALTYRDDRFAGFDAAALVEVIEHLDPERLDAMERVLFEFAAPGTVVVTTPNAEYNALFESLPAGHVRHGDHRFEWTRAEFEEWSVGVAGRHGYLVTFAPVGPLDESHGAPTQMAIFTQSEDDA